MVRRCETCGSYFDGPRCDVCFGFDHSQTKPGELPPDVAHEPSRGWSAVVAYVTGGPFLWGRARSAMRAYRNPPPVQKWSIGDTLGLALLVMLAIVGLTVWKLSGSKEVAIGAAVGTWAVVMLVAMVASIVQEARSSNGRASDSRDQAPPGLDRC